MPEGPLSGVRVFDMTLAAVGPWASQNLGALGADVIHIESPNRMGQPLRGARGINGSAVGYISWNMNKRCITLDLKSSEDRAIAYELLKTCDVFVVNMRPGVADRLGVDYETVAAVNDSIIYCAITGWGEDGPMREIPASDPPVRYLTGFQEGTGAPGQEREGYRFPGQTDFTTGNFSAQAVMMALIARKRTGRGQRIEVTMMHSSAALQSVRIGEYLASGQRAPTLGSAAQSTAPDAAFLCADARYLGVSVTGEREWQAFCHAIEQPELVTDERFSTNSDRVERRAELMEILAPIFLTRPVDYWELTFNEAHIPCGHLIHWSELHHHQQLLANDYLLQVESPHWGTAWTSGPPYHLSGTPERYFATPNIGEHNEEIASELERRRAIPSASPIGTLPEREV